MSLIRAFYARFGEFSSSDGIGELSLEAQPIFGKIGLDARGTIFCYDRGDLLARSMGLLDSFC